MSASPFAKGDLAYAQLQISEKAGLLSEHALEAGAYMHGGVNGGYGMNRVQAEVNVKAYEMAKI
jgi:hypothetical protein